MTPAIEEGRAGFHRSAADPPLADGQSHGARVFAGPEFSGAASPRSDWIGGIQPLLIFRERRCFDSKQVSCIAGEAHVQQRARRSTAPFWSFGASPPMPEDALEFCDFLVKLETAGIPVVFAGAGSVSGYLLDGLGEGYQMRPNSDP